MTQPTRTKEQIEASDDAHAAIGVARKVDKLAGDTLAPLLRRFEIMQWPADFRVIVLNALAHKCLRAVVENER